MLIDARRVLSSILLVVTVVGAFALEDTTPVLLVLALALVVLPRSDWNRRPKRRMRAADWVVLAFTLAALALTLLMPDGVLRWTVIAGIVVAYIVSWPVLARDHELRGAVNDASQERRLMSKKDQCRGSRAGE